MIVFESQKVTKSGVRLCRIFWEHQFVDPDHTAVLIVLAGFSEADHWHRRMDGAH